MKKTTLLLVASLAFACRSAQPALTPAPQTLVAAQPATPTQRALAALEGATAAVREMRESTAPITDDERANAKQVQAAAQRLKKELGALEARVAPKKRKPAAKPQAPAPVDKPPTAEALAKKWTDAIRALGADAAERREHALGEVRAALGGHEPATQHAALITLQRVGDVEFDKAPFRALILPFVETAPDKTLLAAFYALNVTCKADGDLARLHEAWTRDPAALKSSMLHLLAQFGAMQVVGRSEEIALEVLKTKYDRSAIGLNGLWGTKVGPQLEARLLAMANGANRDVAYDALYYALSTLQDKSAAVVDKLIASLAEQDPNAWQRALWGLGHGVPEALQAKVADALVELHNARSEPHLRGECRRIVERYGDEATQAKLLK